MNSPQSSPSSTSAPSVPDIRRTRRRVALSSAAVLALAVPLGVCGTSAQAQAQTDAGAIRLLADSSAAGPASGSAFLAGLGLEQWNTQNVAPGVRVSTVTFQNQGSAPFWTVTLEQPVTSKVTLGPARAEVESESWARTTAAQLAAHGFAARVEAVRWPGYSDTPRGLMGYRVRVGEFPSSGAAGTELSAITAAGFAAVTEWTGYDAQTPADRENIHVAVIARGAFRGTVEATHDGNVAQRATTSSVAAQLGSLVGVNGGFFVTSNADGVQGTQSGLGAYDGQVQSLSSGDRAALVVKNDGKGGYQIANLTSTATVRSGAATFAVEGVNRVPGTVRDCGRPDATPTTHPEQDVDCYETNDLVQFTPEFAAPLPTGTGTQAVLDAAGKVLSVGARGGAVPAGGTVLQGIGTAAAWLDAHAVVGHRLTVDQRIVDSATGRTVHLGPNDSIVSAAPRLLRDGRIDIDAADEGVVDPRDLSFNYQWANARQPRTIAGVDARGDLILVTVDGRLTAGSEGFTLYEEAEFMRSLGAVQALNLDGGGSTAMAVDGRLVNNTSDATGERPVGDTIQVLP
ncbi:phosphodiester glycosidase family protein [Catenulispora pinisilvae]|uniref:phosphodiester glycosidase family protein n=1 Tax=Catenulispora pinisilvae TaxID=2705253 RepID=UPI00189137FB|nr:phosphodiester glycosidase family protein [Catenulispora pinisilvae]